MTVRTTRTGSGSLTPSTDPFPPPTTAPPGDGAQGDSPPVPLVEAELPQPADAAAARAAVKPVLVSEPDSRRAQRIARHQRRQLTVACAVLVAVCLALTILIVSLARDRGSGPPASGQSAVGPVVHVVQLRSPDPVTIPTHQPGATAPEGDHR